MIISTKETHLKGKTENRGLTPRLYRKIENLGKMRKDQIFKIEPRRENINRTSRPFKITATFQKEGKNANFRINKDHLLRIGKLRLFKISHPHSFFRQLILRDTPCLRFRELQKCALRQSGKAKW